MTTTRPTDGWLWSLVALRVHRSRRNAHLSQAELGSLIGLSRVSR